MNQACMLSIIIPAYNAEQFIGEAIDSVLSQNIADFELIIVNDGSTDRTEQIVNNYSESDPRVQVISQDHVGKPSLVRNVGLGIAKGKYIAFVDADDVMYPGKLSAQINILENYSDVGLVVHDYKILNEKTEILTNSRWSEYQYLSIMSPCLIKVSGNLYLSKPEFYNYVSAKMGMHNYTGIHTSVVMIRRSALMRETEYFASDLRLGEDHDLWYRLVKDNKVALIDQVLSGYRRYNASTTAMPLSVVACNLSDIEVYRRNLSRGDWVFSQSDKKAIRQLIASRYVYLAYWYYLEGKIKQARSCYAKGLAYKISIKITLSYLKTWLPFRIVRK